MDALKAPSRNECINYLCDEGILDFFEVGEKKIRDIFDSLNPSKVTPFDPEPEDLYRLHSLIRQRKVFNVLEFGVGFSTVVMAHALCKNRDDYLADKNAPKVRITDPFKIWSVDASRQWISSFLERFADLPFLDRINISYSKCEIGEHNGQICHFYADIPDVVVDFIYLDGPSGSDVDGAINGISFKDCPERTVISGDLLRVEPTFLPGTMILLDGRTNNARFLRNNFKREWKMIHDLEQDYSAFELVEPPLGKINKTWMEYSLGKR